MSDPAVMAAATAAVMMAPVFSPPVWTCPGGSGGRADVVTLLFDSWLSEVKKSVCKVVILTTDSLYSFFSNKVSSLGLKNPPDFNGEVGEIEVFVTGVTGDGGGASVNNLFVASSAKSREDSSIKLIPPESLLILMSTGAIHEWDRVEWAAAKRPSSGSEDAVESKVWCLWSACLRKSFPSFVTAVFGIPIEDWPEDLLEASATSEVGWDSLCPETTEDALLSSYWAKKSYHPRPCS